MAEHEEGKGMGLSPDETVDTDMEGKKEIPEEAKPGSLDKKAGLFVKISGVLGQAFRKIQTPSEWQKHLYGVAVVLMVLDVVWLVLFFVRLDGRFLTLSFLGLSFKAFVPFAAWFVAGSGEGRIGLDLRYRRYTYCVIHAVMVLMEPLCGIGYYVFCPVLFRFSAFRITYYFKGSTALFLAYLLIFLAPAVVGYSLCYNILSETSMMHLHREIARFVPETILDLRKNRDALYDQVLADDVYTNEPIVFREKDRGTHGIFIGPSGTGKTTRIILPAIMQDMQQKVYNDSMRERLLLHMVEEGKAYINIREDDDPLKFKNRYVVPLENFTDEYNEICKRYQTACIVAVGPDSDLGDDVCRMAISMGLTPKYLDPSMEDNGDRLKEFGRYCVGLNPFHIPDEVRGDMAKEAKYVTTVAMNVAEQFEIIDAQKPGTSQRFFTDVNRNITEYVCIINMLYWQRCATPRDCTYSDLQESLNFENMRKMVRFLEECFGTIAGVLRYEGGPHDQKSQKGRAALAGKIARNYANQGYEDYTMGEEKYVKINGVRQKHLVGSIGKESRCYLCQTPWEGVIRYVYTDILAGDRRDKLNEMSYGLRNIYNEFLLNPSVRALMSVQGEDSFQFANAFEDGDVLCVNFAQSLGKTSSIGVGLTFQLAFNRAMLARKLPKVKGMDPSPVFEYMDELPVLLGPWLEPLLEQGRKYGIRFVGAVQGLGQLDKSDTLKYLKGTLLRVGTVVCFGRASLEEMETFSKLSGITPTDKVTTSESQSSILEDNSSLTTSERYQLEEKENISMSEVRNTVEGEVVILRTQGGRVMNGVGGQTHYISQKDRRIEKREVINWRKKSEQYALSEEARMYLKSLEDSAGKIERIVVEVPAELTPLVVGSYSDDTGFTETGREDANNSRRNVVRVGRLREHMSASNQMDNLPESEDSEV